jgi:hypothetical protein
LNKHLLFEQLCVGVDKFNEPVGGYARLDAVADEAIGSAGKYEREFAVA